MARFIRNNRRMLQKTATYYVMHITVAAAVAYAVTGDLMMAFALSLLEPTVQAFASSSTKRPGSGRCAGARHSTSPSRRCPMRTLLDARPAAITEWLAQLAW